MCIGINSDTTSSDIVLINPPSFIEGTLNTQPIPLGLIFINRYIAKYGYQSIIINLADSTSWDDVVERLTKITHPRIIGISSYTRQRFSTFELAALLKLKFPKTIICLGGPHASFLDKAILERKANVDYIIRGEGEETFCELVQQIFSGKIDDTRSSILGISYLDKGNVFVSNRYRSQLCDLSILPLPLQTDDELGELILSDSLKFHFPDSFGDCLRMAPIITSRGCDGNCSFCCNRAFWGNNRCSNAEYSYKQFEYYNNKGICYFDVYDDNFTSNSEQVLELCNMLIRSTMNIKWWCSSRVDTVNLEILEKIKLAGGFMISYGVESGSQLILDNISKGVTITDIESACNLSKKVGLALRITISIGHLGENDATINETIDLINRLQPSQIAIFMLKVYPGTPIASFLSKKHLLSDDYWFKKKNDIVPFFTYEHTQTKLLEFRDRIIDNIQAIIVNQYEDELSSIELDLKWEFA